MRRPRPAPLSTLTLGLILILALGCGSRRSAAPDRPAAPLRHGFNLGALARPAAEAPVRLLVGGHLYGRPGPNAPRPAASLAAATEELARRGAGLFVSLGDLVVEADDEQLLAASALFERMGLPGVNAVGNHDLAPDAETWRTRIGATWFHFDLGALRGIVLDTESDPGRISGPQLRFLREALRDLPARCRVVALFMHKPIFADRPATAPVALAGNDLPAQLRLSRRFTEGPPFRRDLRPLLERCARERRVLLFAGDVGAFEERWGLFHHREEDTGLEFFACGIGDTDRDALLQLDVGARGQVDVEIVPLGPRAPRSLAERDAAAWRERFFPAGLPGEVLEYLNRSR